jgi:MFS family permease
MGFDEAAIGLLLSTHALFSIVVQPFAGALAAKFGRIRVLSWAMTCGFVGHLAVPLVRGFLPMAAAVAVAGVAMGANQPPSMACVAEAAPRELRGLAMAVRLAGNRVGLLLSPIIAGGVVMAWGLPAYFYVSAGMLMGGGAFMATLARRAESDRSHALDA